MKDFTAFILNLILEDTALVYLTEHLKERRKSSFQVSIHYVTDRHTDGPNLLLETIDFKKYR